MTLSLQNSALALQNLAWKNIGPLDNIPVQGARRLCYGHGGRPIAVFRTAADEVFADAPRAHDQRRRSQRLRPNRLPADR